jgi:D-proline reductase (dithiol) PrdB
MNKQTRLTPISRWRERLVRLANDTEWGEHLAYWVGKTAGGLQLRLENLRTTKEIPWTPLRRPIAQATVAVVTTGGVHLCIDEPFNLKTDATFRAIPRNSSSADLCITHEHYDRRDALRDLNLIFPLERLLELEAAGIIGRVADVNYSFGFVQDPRDLLAPGHQVGKLLAQAEVDLVILVPA